MIHLLTIEEAFSITGRGLIVLPEIPVHIFEDKTLPTTVTLKYKNGSEEIVEASFHIPRISSSDLKKEIFYWCMLQAKQKEDISIGTELWVHS